MVRWRFSSYGRRYNLRPLFTGSAKYSIMHPCTKALPPSSNWHPSFTAARIVSESVPGAYDSTRSTSFMAPIFTSSFCLLSYAFSRSSLSFGSLLPSSASEGFLDTKIAVRSCWAMERSERRVRIDQFQGLGIDSRQA